MDGVSGVGGREEDGEGTDEKRRRRVQRRVTAGKAQKKGLEVNISNRRSDPTGCPSNRRRIHSFLAPQV